MLTTFQNIIVYSKHELNRIQIYIQFIDYHTSHLYNIQIII